VPETPHQAITYCVVPRDLAEAVHEPLRRHFLGDPSVVVVVEMRAVDRRRTDRRTGTAAAPAADRRKIRAEMGRRVADRRAMSVPVKPPVLPARLRRHLAALVFVERLEPSNDAALDIDTARLVVRCQGGDPDAFGELYMRYFDRVFSYVRVVLEDHQEAEDVTQDIFVKVFEALPRYVALAGTPFRAWMFRIARNAALDRMKRAGRLLVEEPQTIDRRVDEAAPPGGALDLDWISDGDLLFLVERLPQAQRQVLVLRYVLGMNTQEIAVVMERTPQSVAQLHSRARAFLEDRLRAIRGRDTQATRRSPMLIRLRRMPVLGARRTVLGSPPSGRRR
jgi:RNA polymerase sigma-70 factor (ECF subfamily)